MACRAGTDITDRFINGNRCIGTAISMVYVLVFVSSTDEFAAAQSHVHEWKERERIRSNLYIRYFIIVAPASGHGSNSVSMRYILIFLEQWINDFATNFDVVVALNGLLGAQAFRAPRPTEGRRGPGIAPYLQEDQDSACIKMFAPIVFSRISTLDMGINDGLQCPFDMNQSLNRAHGCSDEMELVDVRAFAGTVDHLRAMLNHILRRDILFMLKINAEVNLDDQHVICSLKRFAIIHPYLVGVDVNRSYFDHNKETQDKPFKSNRALSALARLATVVPIRHCSFPQYSETIENAIIGLIEEDTKMVNESKLSEIDSVGFNALLNNELCFSLGLSWRAFELLRYTPQYWVPVARLYWCAIAAPMVSFNISLEEKKAAIHFLSAQLKVLNTNDALDLPFRGLSRMIHLYMSALYQEIGPYHLAAKHFSLSADAALYEDVEIKRLLWSQQRQSYKNYLSQRLRETLAMPKITRKNSVKSVEEQDWMAKIGIRRNGRDVLARNRARYASYCDSSLAKESGDAAKRCGVVLDDEVIPMRKPQIHVYTLATERRPGLDYLEFAANIAGIKLKVISNAIFSLIALIYFYIFRLLAWDISGMAFLIQFHYFGKLY